MFLVFDTEVGFSFAYVVQPCQCDKTNNKAMKWFGLSTTKSLSDIPIYYCFFYRGMNILYYLYRNISWLWLWAIFYLVDLEVSLSVDPYATSLVMYGVKQSRLLLYSEQVQHFSLLQQRWEQDCIPSVCTAAWSSSACFSSMTLRRL